VDETSHIKLQRPPKIIAKRGKHEIGAISLCEPGQIITRMYAVSASDFYIPPMLICPRKRTKDSLSYGASPRSFPWARPKLDGS
jgi:hypothetical protein